MCLYVHMCMCASIYVCSYMHMCMHECNTVDNSECLSTPGDITLFCDTVSLTEVSESISIFKHKLYI